MQILLVVNNPKDWPLRVSGVQIVSARSYLTEPTFDNMGPTRVLNLSRTYRYQSTGYYVSLLAEARGHRPEPSVATIEDLKSQTLARLYSDDLVEQIRQTLTHVRTPDFTLSIYFGRNVAKRYDRLALRLFSLFRAPLLRAYFVRDHNGWHLQRIAPIAYSAIPENHREFVAQAASQYFSGRRRGVRAKVPRFDIAILYNAQEPRTPSNRSAIRKFMRAARDLRMEPHLIDKSDYGRLAEFDALFIRETTAVNHHTYRFARRALAEGLAVIDDPISILRCTNKVYQAELLEHYKIPTPKTMIVHRDNIGEVEPTLGLPCVLKQPDSSFSQGVVKASDSITLVSEVVRLLQHSDLIIAQEFLPTEFDWRVGVIDGEPLHVCRYYMAKDHWQIIKNVGNSGRSHFGRVETLGVDKAPARAVKLALRAAHAVGNGFYGIDIKQSGGKYYIIEINDNPNVDAGYEDAVLGDDLYRRIMMSFVRRLEQKQRAAA